LKGKNSKGNPPYTHNLTLLCEKSGLYDQMTDNQKDFLDFLEPLNIEARYPTIKGKLLEVLNEQKCQELINRTEGELAWVMKKL
jgi:HEPN domain-containing protein